VVRPPKSAPDVGFTFAASPDAADASGAYFDDCDPVDPAPAARDEARQRDLWDLSERLTGLDPAETVG
jgi:hypothetical protein